MSEPLTNTTPEDVLPYAPKWASQSGYRNAQPNVAYDVFSEQENPSYRSMAELFSPQTTPKKKSNHTTKMLVRFGAVVGVAGGALALFVGYIATQPDGAENASRFKNVTSAVATVQAALAPASPVDRPAPVMGSAEPAAPAPAELAAQPEPAPVKPAEIPSDRGAAPQPPPAEIAPLQAAPVAAPSSAPKQVATLVIEPPSAPAAPQLSAGELTTLMARGRRFVESGDFSSARPVYRRAAEAGYAEAALALGETYDPRALSERGAVGINGDAEQARKWYERAAELGSLEAPTRLGHLPRN
jgi:hypothetical protein